MPFRRRSSWLALLFSTLLVLLASAQSLHEQLAHQYLADHEHCEYCLLSLDPDGLIPPLLIVLPAMMLDLAPAVLVSFIAPRRLLSGAGARDPPEWVVIR